MAKNQRNAKQNSWAELLLFENYTLSSFMLSFKTSMRYSKKCAKNRWNCFNEIVCTYNENKTEMKNGSRHK